MGIFSKKKIYVASALQNLAGDELERPNYLKTAVVGHVISGDKNGISSTLQRAYLHGPGLKLRRFFNWSLDNYSAVGVPLATLGGIPIADPEIVATQIPASGQVNVQKTEIGGADFTYWAERYILQNFPERIDTEWTMDYLEATNQIRITYEDLSTSTFTPSGFSKNGLYVYASYFVTLGGGVGSWTTGATTTVPGPGSYPSTVGWTLFDNDFVPGSFTLHTITDILITYSDSRPDETSHSDTTSAGGYTNEEEVYTRVTYEGTTPTGEAALERHERMHFIKTASVASNTTVTTTSETIAGGVTKTTQTTTTTETVAYTYSWRVDERADTVVEWSGQQIFIYRVLTGNAVLDNLVIEGSAGSEEFMPFVPLRLNNNFISPTNYPDAYTQGKKALKRAFNADFDKLVEQIEAGENLEDIDHAYVTFGVSINVLENSCRKYIYSFFKKLMDLQNIGPDDYSGWQAQVDLYNESYPIWENWYEEQKVPGSALYGTPEPTWIPYPTAVSNNIGISSSGSLPTNFDMRITWSSIEESFGFGLAKPGAKTGEVWFESGFNDPMGNRIFGTLPDDTRGFLWIDDLISGDTNLYWQVDQANWKCLRLRNFVHRNYIYKGKYVETTLEEGLEDEDESGFLVPLHIPTLKEMSIVDTTQMSTACAFIVYNCYKVKKTSIFKSLFKIFLIIVVIVVVVYAPQLAPQVAQAALATGTAIGLSGALAVAIGAAINAIAAMIITSLIMKASIAVFGEKWGRIIGTAISIVAMNGFENLVNGQGFIINFGNMMSAANIMTLATATGNAYAAWVMADAAKTFQKTEALQEDYERESKEISQKYLEQFGYGNGIVDPLLLLDSVQGAMIETPGAFLDRTLMTGNDVADMSFDMITNFVEFTIGTQLPTVD